MTVDAGPDTLGDRVADAINRHRSGDPDALSDLFRIVQPLLRQIARSYRLSPFAADDLIQNTFELIMIYLPGLRDPACGLGWLSVIARREAFRVLREQRRTDPIEYADEVRTDSDADDPEQRAMANLARSVLERTLAKLPPQSRDLLFLLFLDGTLGYAAIAVRLGMPIGSIGPNRQRALTKVRQLLTQDRDLDLVRCA